VAYVRLRHKEIVVTDRGRTATASCASIHGHMLADRVPLTNDQPRSFSFVFEILGRAANVGEWKNSRLAPNAGHAFDYDVTPDRHFIVEFDVITDYGIRTDRHIPAKLGP
jgi:hypothetical protein